MALASVACALLLTGILSKSARLYGEEINVTYHGNPRPSLEIFPTPGIVIYNRVGKCGSRTVLSTIKSTLKSRKDDALKVRYLADAKTGNSTALTPEEQNHVVAQTTSAFANGSSPTFYARHMNFLNFADIGSELKPVYINLVRYPVDRFISHFNFKRNGDNRLQGRRIRSTTHNLNYTLRECVTDDDKYRECSADTMFYMIPFFCGQAKMCKSPSEASFDRAVQNLEQNFILVGLTEQMDDFFVLLQKIFPVYFEDITKFWKINGQKYSHETAAPKKRKVDGDVYQMIANKMQLEIKFYELVKKRFYAMKAELLLNDRLPSYTNAVSKNMTMLKIQ